MAACPDRAFSVSLSSAAHGTLYLFGPQRSLRSLQPATGQKTTTLAPGMPTVKSGDQRRPVQRLAEEEGRGEEHGTVKVGGVTETDQTGLCTPHRLEDDSSVDVYDRASTLRRVFSPCYFAAPFLRSRRPRQHCKRSLRLTAVSPSPLRTGSDAYLSPSRLALSLSVYACRASAPRAHSRTVTLTHFPHLSIRRLHAAEQNLPPGVCSQLIDWLHWMFSVCSVC